MWRTQLNKSIREVRFVLKEGKDHHGLWRWIDNKLPTMRMLNPNTTFGIVGLTEDYKTNSACYLVYGDTKFFTNNIEEEILSKGVTMEQFDEILKEKVAYGKTLTRETLPNNSSRYIPYDVVEARNSVKWLEDGPF